MLHGIICDAQGRKMSKSLGNVVDPMHIINGATLKVCELWRLLSLIYAYRSRTILTRCFYILNPILNDKSVYLEDFFFSLNSVLMIGYYSRAFYNKERDMMARVR